MTDFFKDIPEIKFDGSEDANDFAYRHYDPTEIVNGKTMAENLRFAVAYWHSFAWPGGDPFGGQTFDRPWFGDTMALAKLKADVAFEMFRILGQPYYCWHDADVRPEGATLKESRERMEEMADYLGEKMEATGTKLLWGTANLFSNRRFMSGAATGREGYETLLNTDLRREREQAGRFLTMVVDYAKKIGFNGAILIEPKPQEPTKHQYDFDVSTVYAFLKDFGLEDEVKVNIEQGHAILAGHSFEHEIATAAALDIFGSIDMNRNDYQSGWDTDQFPNNVPEVALAYYEILRAGGFSTGGTNFDSKLRRQSLDPEDLILAHVGAFDICARGYKAAVAMQEDGALETARAARYAGWDTAEGKAMLTQSLEEIAARVEAEGLDPEPRSGRQERLENTVNRFV